MNRVAAGIALGILSLHFWQFIPDYIWFITALMIGGVVSYFFRFNVLIWVVLGTLVAKIGASCYTHAVQAIPNERGNITIVGKVSSLLNADIPTTSFNFNVLSIEHSSSSRSLPIKVRLEWSDATVMKQGETWQLSVRLRRPYGRVNQAGFDAEQYYVGNGIHGKGIVISGVRLNDRSQPSFRQKIFDQAVQLTDGLQYQSYLLALGFGYRDGLDNQDWLRLRDSGLAHLMAISGLHIGLALLCGWWLGCILRGTMPEWCMINWLPLWLGLLFALGYAWLAGFSLPTLRALLMSTIVMGLLRMKVQWPGWQIWLTALVVCLCVNPLGSYSASFWLSFSAVFILYFAGASGMRLLHHSEQTWSQLCRARLRLLLQVQLVLLVMMLPLQWQWFGGVSLLAPLINYFAVPLVSILTVPFVLAAIAGSGLSSVSVFFWTLADYSLVPVMLLAELASGAWWDISSTLGSYLLGVVGCLFVMWFLPLRRFCALHFVLILTVVCWQGGPVSEQKKLLGEEGWQLEMLDVGHGLAVVVRRNGTAVLYDTGNRWQQGSIATAVIEPVLLSYGITRLDGLILSHADSDHAGGTQDIIERMRPEWKRSSDRRDGFAPCIRGEHWQWQQLDFRVLWPPKLVSRAANPHSCVIEVSDRLINPAAPTSALLTGDIDAISELLLAQLEPDLNPDILFVPHHGSRTSSTATWLKGMSPRYALVSVARYNPWHLPSPDIRQRYLDKQAIWLATSDTGQVRVDVKPGKLEVLRYRQDIKNSWYRELFSQKN
ncbi:DNA internalization-related competence protein ComEC/Rec2 [Photobacterium sp. J15]|uniref:DNA internalization-related competence protein ComEC/Rec2 n=1 Tax=Photobacterium sp. J15 TaxID=265901 RepID=UPI0007E373DC|nr:DNA internalization-related competence protein ComEC/Rec2 [Photobacterium sp. J15]